MARLRLSIASRWDVNVDTHKLDRWDISAFSATLPAISREHAIDLAVKEAHRLASCPPWRPLQRHSEPFARAKRAADHRRDLDIEQAPVIISDHKRKDDAEPLTLFPVGANGSPATPMREAA
jgi:hypothetical protein